MTQTRKEMLQRKLIDNLDKAAEEMVAYVADFQNNEAVADIIKQVEKEYQLVYGSILLGWASRVLGYRVRQSEISVLIATINQMRNSFVLLDAISTLFTTGGWDTTSVNTRIAFAILAKLPAYQHSDPDLFASLPNLEIRKRIGELFIDRARSHKLCERFFAESQETKKKDLQTFTVEHKQPARNKKAYETLLLARLKADKAEEQAKAAKVPLQRGPKLDQAKVNSVASVLGGILARQSIANAAKAGKLKPIQELPFEEPPLLQNCASPEPDNMTLPTMMTGMNEFEEGSHIPLAPPPPPVFAVNSEAEVKPQDKVRVPMSYKAALLKSVQAPVADKPEPKAETVAPVVEGQKKIRRHAYKAELTGSINANDPRLSMVSSMFGENAKKLEAKAKGLAAAPGAKTSSPGKWG